LRDDYRIYAKHLSKKLGLVLTEHDLSLQEVAEIFFIALRDRMELFLEQPTEEPLKVLIKDISILVEYLWVDPARVEYLTRTVHDDRSSVENHGEVGVSKLNRLKLRDPMVMECLTMHHERVGGAGYPKRIMKDALPARPVVRGGGLSFCAMVSKRPHREARDYNQAAIILIKDAVRYDVTLTKMLAVFVTKGVVDHVSPQKEEPVQ